MSASSADHSSSSSSSSTSLRASLATLWDLTRGDRLRYAAAMATMAVAVLVVFGVPRLIGFAVDVATDDFEPPRDGDGVIGAFERALADLAHDPWTAAGAVVALTAVSGAFHFLRGRWAAQSAESVARRLRDRLYGHLSRLPCAYHDRAETGDLVQRCTSDVDTVRMFMVTQLVEIARATLMVALAAPVLWAIDETMTLVSFVLYPPILVFAVVFFRRVRRSFQAMDEAEGAMTARLQESLTGVRVVRAFSRQEYECAAFGARNAELRDRSFTLIRTLAAYWAVSDLLCFSQLMLVLFHGASVARSGALTIGELVAFVQLEMMVIWPVRQTGRVLADAGKAVVAIGRVREILDEPEEDADDAPVADGHVMPADGASITARGLRFAFAPDAAPVLDGLDLHVAPGEVLALVGPPGCGKSVFVQLLLRLYDPPRGALFVGGRDVLDWDRAALRSQVSTVLQEPFLYSRSLRRNLALGAPDAHPELVETSARDAAVHDAITSFDDGYETVIGERGVTLSGGQRQRVAIARALLKDAPILVLDDALSAVDTKTEATIVDALAAREGRRTTVVIAHRLSSVVHADRIAVLEAGRVVQLGAHRELIARDGPYRRLWAIQSSLEAQLDDELRRIGEPA